MAYIKPKQLGSGTPSGTTFLRGDGTWAVPPGGGSNLITPRFVLNGKPKVLTGVDGAFVTGAAATITRITLYRRTAGTSGSTIVDVNRNGVTVFTTQANRPQVAFGAGANAIHSVTNMDVTAINAGDRIELDIDAIEGGNPMDVSVMVEMTYP